MSGEDRTHDSDPFLLALQEAFSGISKMARAAASACRGKQAARHPPWLGLALAAIAAN